MNNIKLETILDIQHTLSSIQDWLETDAKFSKPQAKVKIVREKIIQLRIKIRKDLNES